MARRRSVKQCIDNNDLHRRKKIIGYCVRNGIDHGSTDQTIAEFTKKYSLSAPCTKSSTRPVQSTVKLHL